MSTDSRRARQTRWNHPALTLSLMTILAGLARGRSLDPWATAVLIVGGLTYSGAQVILSRRS